MADKKKTREEQIDNVQNKLEDSRKARLELAAKRASRTDKNKVNNYVLFQEWWATERKSYGKEKNLEEILWLHLKAIKKDSPENFETGVQHFGLKKGN